MYIVEEFVLYILYTFVQYSGYSENIYQNVLLDLQLLDKYYLNDLFFSKQTIITARLLLKITPDSACCPSCMSFLAPGGVALEQRDMQ